MRPDYDFSKAKKSPYSRRVNRRITASVDEPTLSKMRRGEGFPLRDPMPGKTPRSVRRPEPTRRSQSGRVPRITPIRCDHDHAAALVLVDRLWSNRSKAAVDALEVLSVLIDDYERRCHGVDPPEHPAAGSPAPVTLVMTRTVAGRTVRTPMPAHWDGEVGDFVIRGADALSAELAVAVELARGGPRSGTTLSWIRRCLGVSRERLASALQVPCGLLEHWEDEDATIDAHAWSVLASMALGEAARHSAETDTWDRGWPEPITMVLERDCDGWWIASAAGLQGCHTNGRTLPQVRRRFREALALFVDHASTVPILERRVATQRQR